MSDHIPLVVVAETTPQPKADKPLKLRHCSPIIFLYPSVVMAIACGIGSGFGQRSAESPGKLGLVFTLFFFVNLTVITFEYTKKSSLAVLGVSLLVGILGWQSDMVAHLIRAIFDQPLFMNATYYWIWAMFLLFLIGFAWVSSQIEHWRVEGDQFVRRGLWKQQESYSVASLTMTAEVSDVLEYALLKSGRITVYQAPGIPVVRLRNVINVKVIGAQLLAALENARRAMPQATPVHPESPHQPTAISGPAHSQAPFPEPESLPPVSPMHNEASLTSDWESSPVNLSQSPPNPSSPQASESEMAPPSEEQNQRAFSDGEAE